MGVFAYIKNGVKYKMNQFPGAYPASRVSYNGSDVETALDELNADLSDTCKMKEITQTWGSTTSGTTYAVGVVNALLGLTPSSVCIGSVAIGGDAAIDTDGTLFINAGTVYYKCGYTQNNTQATFCLIYK